MHLEPRARLASRRRFAPLVILASALIALLTARVAHAHAVGLSRAEYRVDGAEAHVRFVFANAELASTFPAIDADHDGAIASREIAAATSPLDRGIVQSTHVTSSGAPCAAHLDAATLGEADAIDLDATFTCPGPIASLAVDCAFLDRFAAGHRHLASVSLRGAQGTFVATLAQPRFAIEGGAPPATSFASMVRTGVEHILTGYDHLAFLFGLLLLGGTVRSLVGTITAFTIAHSITLALAALHVVTIAPSVVEPAIALSIAYVGVENFFARDPSKRWRITFPFGLVHGFGFAGALAELDLPRAQVPIALFAFNLGVELGQLGVLAIVLPVITIARRSAWFRDIGVKALSGAVALAGVVWFVLRVRG